MTGKKNDNVLALPPLTSDFGTTANTSLVPWDSRRPLTKAGKRLVEEAHKQRLVIDIITTKARFGASMIGKIHEHGGITFNEATSCLMEIKDQPGRNPQHQAYIDQFTEHQVQLLARQLLAVIDVSATGIGVEVHRDPHPPERPAGLLKRWFDNRE
jgi:hypothetical protein